jgi:hypothetical protein
MTITGFALPIRFTGCLDGLSSAAFADTVRTVTPVAGRTERMVSICTFSAGEASVVDVAVLLLTAIGVFGAFRSALCAVDVEVAFVSIDHTYGPLVDPFAGRPFDGTGATGWARVNRIQHVGRVSNVLHVKNVPGLGVRGGIADISIQRPV